MKNYLKVAITSSLVVMSVTTVTAFAASVPDFTMYGFPTVVATAEISANSTTPTTVKADGATFSIPAGFSPVAVKFEILKGKLSTFASKAPSSQTPIYDFAFKVINQKTTTLVGKFQKPVTFSYTNSNVDSKSMYYNIATNGDYTANAKSMTIKGDTMTHLIAGAPVGWVVTSPASMVQAGTSPVTGLPFSTWLSTGLGLIAAGGLLIVFRKRLS